MTEKNKEIDQTPSDRERLIVPEEIFAPEPEEELPSEEDTLGIAGEADEAFGEDAESEDEPIADESVQIAFFTEDTHTRLSEADSTDWESLDEDGYDEKKPRLADKIFDFVELFAVTVLAVLVLSAFVFRHAVVDGSSMQGTLEHGEHLIVSNLFYTPERSDVIVFQDKTLPEGLCDPIVKRIIGIEGDRIFIDYDGTVYVNGKEFTTGHEYYLEGYYITDGKPYIYAQGYEYTVPEGHVFILGDNRNHSTDSRVIGPIDTDTILGKVLIRVYPFDSFGKI